MVLFYDYKFDFKKWYKLRFKNNLYIWFFSTVINF